MSKRFIQSTHIIKPCLSLLFLVFNFFTLKAQHTYVKSFPKLIESGTAFEATDGFIYIAAKTPGNGGSDIAFTKLNQMGNVVWSKVFGGNGEEWCDQQNITELNGKITLVVNSNSFGSGNGWDILCMTFDTAGNLIRQKNIGGNDSDPVYTIQVNVNRDGYLIGGATLSTCSFGSNDHYVLKVDTLFNIQSTHHYGTWIGETWSNFELFSNGNIVVSGVTNVGPHPWNGNIIYTNSSGNVIWAKYITGAGLDVVESNDNHIVTVGGNTGTMSLLKIDLNGNVVFAKNLLPGSWGSKIIKTKDKGYAIIGSTNAYSLDGTQSDVILIKLDSNYNTEWTKSYGIKGSDEGSMCFFEKQEGGFFILSSGSAWGTKPYELIFISTDSKGNSFCNDATIVMPNPNFYNASQGNVGAGASCNFIANDATVTKTRIQLDAHFLCINCTGENEIKLPFSDTLKVCVDSTILQAGKFQSYKWNTGDTSATLLVKKSGLYWVTLTNSIGCQASDSIYVLFGRAKFTVSDSIVCAGDAPIELIPDRLSGIFWGRNVKGNQFIVDTNSGNFTVYYAIQNEFCADTSSIQIQVKAKPNASFYFEDSMVCLGNTPVVIHCKNNGGLLKGMFLNDGNFIPQKLGDYTITYELQNDFCIDSTSQTIHVIDGSDVHIPNVFSPNEDGKNDVFKILGVSTEKFQLSIFNRWGQLLFESNNPSTTWDGKYNAESVPEGVYFYLIQALDECHQPYNLRGTVQVLR